MAYLPNSKNGTQLIIKRVAKFPYQIQGVALVVTDNYDVIYCMASLELPHRNNMRNVSAIPSGTYQCEKIMHPRFKESAIVKNVAGRDEIMIHRGNYNFHTEGCILLGYDFQDLNLDGLKDVSMSGTTMAEFYKKINKHFLLIIE